MKLLEGYCVYPDTEIPSLQENDRISKLLTGLLDGSLIDLICGVRSDPDDYSLVFVFMAL